LTHSHVFLKQENCCTCQRRFSRPFICGSVDERVISYTEATERSSTDGGDSRSRSSPLSFFLLIFLQPLLANNNKLVSSADHQRVFRGFCSSTAISLYKYTTVPLSVQAQYSRLCPISSSFRYNNSLFTWTVLCMKRRRSCNSLDGCPPQIPRRD
jgi:hypothetical protein